MSRQIVFCQKNNDNRYGVTIENSQIDNDMSTSIKSHVFFVGNLPHRIGIKSIFRVFGGPVIESPEKYEFLCSYFHKSHIDAMIEARGQKRPRFLDAVHHYCLEINKTLPLSLYDPKSSRLDVLDGYKMNLKGLHVYCFPLGITLFAIEIEDSGSSLDDLTLAHLRIRELPARWDELSEGFRDALKPIRELVPNNNIRDLVSRGNKLKIFQIILVKSGDWTDKHLYEIATSSRIDIVGTSDVLAPSDDYYYSMIKENTIAPFKNWRAMSLMDSFTALIKNEGDFDEEKEKEWSGDEIRWINSYYRLIYLRVLVQKTFLSSRNDQYRLNLSNVHLMRDLTRMEQYYFYDNISYNFLPDMLNRQMEKGMGINEEREELSTQIKESENKNANTIAGIVSAFAVFSIAYDFYGILKAITDNNSKIMPFAICIMATLSVFFLVFYLYRRR